LSIIFSEKRFHPRIKSKGMLFGIMLQRPALFVYVTGAIVMAGYRAI
jgi:hypothetical protein